MDVLAYNSRFIVGASLLEVDEGNPSVGLNAGAVVVNGADGAVQSRDHLDLQNDSYPQLRANGTGGVWIDGFRVPQTAIPYQSAPTAESLRDALVAAGYMAAEESA